ncbi:MAG TPA: DsbA family protein [Alphaproteobacteria bacterium]|nr:DsbA family protein [Alphaproteobacteria bacterium]
MSIIGKLKRTKYWLILAVLALIGRELAVIRKLKRTTSWLILTVLLAAGGWFAVQKLDAQESTTAPADAFEQRVRNYLLEHPEVLVEALQRYQQQQQIDAAGQDRAAIAAHRDALLSDEAAPVGGNPEGDVTLVEFFDYNCPYCRRVAPAVLEAEQKDPQLRVVYKEFPILGPNSDYAARAALAAHRQSQEKYIELHKALMASSGVVDEARVLETARSVGLDLGRLKADMEDPVIAEAIAGNLALAEALRITGTPGFVIGDIVFRGATDTASILGLIKRARSGSAE